MKYHPNVILLTRIYVITLIAGDAALLVGDHHIMVLLHSYHCRKC